MIVFLFVLFITFSDLHCSQVDEDLEVESFETPYVSFLVSLQVSQYVSYISSYTVII